MTSIRAATKEEKHIIEELAGVFDIIVLELKCNSYQNKQFVNIEVSLGIGIIDGNPVFYPEKVTGNSGVDMINKNPVAKNAFALDLCGPDADPVDVANFFVAYAKIKNYIRLCLTVFKTVRQPNAYIVQKEMIMLLEMGLPKFKINDQDVIYKISSFVDSLQVDYVQFGYVRINFYYHYRLFLQVNDLKHKKRWEVSSDSLDIINEHGKHIKDRSAYYPDYELTSYGIAMTQQNMRIMLKILEPFSNAVKNLKTV